MNNKKIMHELILILIVSLSFAAVYSAEIGEVSHNDSSNSHDNIHISGSNNITDVMGSVSPIHQFNYENTTIITFN